MAKPELGTKRVCPVTGRKFYDMNKNPVISPYTGEVVPIAPVAAARSSRAEAKVVETAGAEPEVETAEAEGAELVSLEDADAEAQGKKTDMPDTDDDLEVEDDGGDDDSTFIEEDEEGDDDVTDIIGDGIEKDEET